MAEEKNDEVEITPELEKELEGEVEEKDSDEGKEEMINYNNGDSEVVEKKKLPQELQKYKTEETDIMSPVVYRQMKVIANDFIKSGAIPKGFENSDQVFVAMQAGREMGMKPYESMQSLYIVNGSLNLWGKATIRRVREFGYKVEYKNETPEKVTAVISKDDEEYSETYTFAEAEKSGYTKGHSGLKFGWKEGVNRKLKLRYGALNMIIRTSIPEVFGSTLGIVEVSEDVDIKDIKSEVADKKEALLEKLKGENDENN